MIIAKVKGQFSVETREQLKHALQSFFENEKVLVVNAEMLEIEFVNFGKFRCSYCGTLQKDTNAISCHACGAAYQKGEK